MKELTSHIESKINSIINSLEKTNNKDIIEIAKSIVKMEAFSDGKFNEVKGDIDEKTDKKYRPFEATLTAMSHLYLAQKHCEDKNFHQAINQLCEGYRKLGGAEKIISEQAITEANTIEKTRNAGKARHKKSEGLDSEILKKLTELKPNSGWKSFRNAAELIKINLENFLNEKKFTKTNFQSLIENHIRTNEELRNVFIENSSEKWKQRELKNKQNPSAPE